MSVIHVNQIRAQIKKFYEGKILLSDINATGNDLENFFLTRGLAAYTLPYTTHVAVRLATLIFLRSRGRSSLVLLK